MSIILSLIVLGFLVVLRKLYRQFTRISIAHIPGPKPGPFLLGNIPQLFQGQAADTDFRWQAQYGDVFILRAPLGEDQLWISDPKALQYIYQTSGYKFCKQPGRRELSRIVSGRGIVWAEGDMHKRHRKVMLPGFSGLEAKACVPIFFAYACKLGDKWKDIMSSNASHEGVFNIPYWASRTTLDAIGKAAFDYEFGALDDADNALGKAYANIMVDTFGKLSNVEIFIQNIIGAIPTRIRHMLVDYMPSRKLRRLRATAKLAHAVAKSLVDSKSDALLQGKGNKDIMSLLVKANASENEKTQLSEEELLSQMRTIIIAGHETTANTLSWLLFELSRQPDIQRKLRNEIRFMEKTIQSRGDSDFTAADFDTMPYLSAFLKEGLRFYPIVFSIFRQATKDDILPLSKPITTTSGEVIKKIPIPKGQKILASIIAYNRNKELFGEDSHVFDPERWLDSRVKGSTSVGVFGNLMTFSGGVRACIGWKFAVMELQAFLIELVGQFEFELTSESRKVKREPALVMVPTIEGQLEMGSQLPLRVRAAPREDI